jgi:ClpP class serine protease
VDALSFLWIFLIVIALLPALQRQMLASRRRRFLGRLSEKRGATVITLIHRQETISFLGVPIFRHIDIDDAESVLRAIRETPPGQPIEIILHTPGGLVLASSQIALALADHDGPVTAVVPHYAMSGGTMIALAADEIVVDRHAALGPIDPQLGQYPAASILAALDYPGPHRDEFLVLGDISRKALRQVEVLARQLLERNVSPERAKDVARLLSTGKWTHDHPLMPSDLEPLGLPVKVGVPEEERELLELYPQPRGRQSPVEYFPGTPVSPGMPPGRERPRRPKPERTGSPNRS